ncbi:hypothetical protein KSP40_PGU015514 [Platanthera guangdongensis]|uniref:Uncharacterized protein n=1 Tax=Platanthera guangdongensis TaxID=2320717 RepID=A0ABR2LLP8_9ASPA
MICLSPSTVHDDRLNTYQAEKIGIKSTHLVQKGHLSSGSKIRRRHGWRDWILNMDQNRCNVEPESPSTTTSQQSLVSPLESITLTEHVESNGDTST